jgi:two-component system, cell cycle response regulator
MRILVAEDDPVTRLTLASLLSKRGHEVIAVENGDLAYAVLLRDDAPPLAILDWMMPGRDGVEVCRDLRKLGKTSYTYVVMLTGKREKEDFIAGLAAGADEYVRKPFDIDELHARIEAAERILKIQDALRTKAHEDELTGALNRAGIRSMLERVLAHAEREGTEVSVILADIDHFKRVNDKHGHAVGDAVLREVVRRFGWGLRAYDGIGRFGGEEFLIVVPGCVTGDAVQVAERLRGYIASEPLSDGTFSISITVSFGVASTASGIDAPDGLMKAADEALYRAKNGGRNLVIEHCI